MPPMAKNEKTSTGIGSKASGLLRSRRTSPTTKSVAASALTQSPDRDPVSRRARNENTSSPVGSKASKLLRSRRTTANVKSVAGSALTQRPDHSQARRKPVVGRHVPLRRAPRRRCPFGALRRSSLGESVNAGRLHKSDPADAGFAKGLAALLGRHAALQLPVLARWDRDQPPPC
jgi:hypothetical protein